MQSATTNIEAFHHRAWWSHATNPAQTLRCKESRRTGRQHQDAGDLAPLLVRELEKSKYEVVAGAPSGGIYWGEYFYNRERAEVHIYASIDGGLAWQIAYTFPAGSIRHVHNIIYDRWGDCLWILTGDEGAECKVLPASCDLRSIEVVLAGNQQARAVAAIPTETGLYLSTDTPSEKNHVYRLDRAGNVEQVGDLASSSIYGCRVGKAMFFSTMIEPSVVNASREVQIAGSSDGANWQVLASWKKDRLPMRYFQYGNAFLPGGENSTRYLAATTIAVERDDLVTTIWEVESA